MRSCLRCLGRARPLLVVVATLVAPSLVRAQFLGKSAPRVAVDANPGVSPASPRASLLEFRRFAKAHDWVHAAEYLAVSPADSDQAPLLARRLQVVLDQRLALNPLSVSPLALGDTTDGDALGDRIGLIAGPGAREDPVRLVRTTVDGRARWVFSLATVKAVNAWYENLGAPWLRDRLPSSLMREGPWKALVAAGAA